jgi:hypothetical protein
MNTEEFTYGKRSSRGRSAQSSRPRASAQGQRGSRNSRTPTSPFRDVRLLPALALQIIY